MAPPNLLLLLAIAASRLSGSVALTGNPKIFLPVSNATCLSEYAWMDDEEGDDPCLTVAYVIAACAGDTWTQPALPSGYSYDPPNGTTATPCYCSWSCYNLMMGCTICQGSAYTSDVETWASFSQNCPSSYTNTYFPSGYVLAGNASIPYWASIDPNSWTSAVFNYEQAQSYASEGKPDLKPSISSTSTGSSKSTNVGAIVGGTVGGAAALLILGIVAYIVYRRRKYNRVPTRPGTVNPFDTPTHARWLSDSSTVLPRSNAGSPPPISYSSTPPPTFQYGPSDVGYQSFNAMSPPPPTDTATYTTSRSSVRNPSIPVV